MLTRLKKKIERNRKYRNTIRELNRLTDRDLADMGITKYDIERIAKDSL